MKKIMALLLAVLMLAACVLSVSAAGSYIKGDADSDGSVTILDATAIQRVLAFLSVESFDERAADILGDGLDIVDATRIQRYIVQLGNPFGIGEIVSDPDAPTESQTPATQPPTEKSSQNYELPFVPV